MRGKVFSHLPSIVNKGITPAYAGKSPRVAVSSEIQKDHPRLCGEKHLGIVKLKNARGSPPPMRGKALSIHKTGSVSRITPAYAGKSIFINTLFQLFKDHPRLCGEKLFPRASASGFRGSPPPMRGKVPPDRKWTGSLRITPAYAGKRLVLCMYTNVL